jgi:5,5'-dehydrodivanillate O-demethylase
MLTQEQNHLLTCTCPGKPAGELFRRYWQPVGLSSEITSGGKPREVKVLGEELVLFRDQDGRLGLLGLHCPHRLCSLAYGRVEDGGIRCPFHGWLLNREGKCLEQPAEPEPFTDKINHPAYPCQELGGLIFAYLGPRDKMPLLPRYEVLVRDDGTRKVDYYLINSNYLQNVEGAVDTVHAPYLHMDRWSQCKTELARLPKPETEFRETDFGIWQKSRLALPGPNGPFVDVMYGHFFMPAGFIRIQDSLRGHGDIKKYQSWYVPVDDTHTMRFQASLAPFCTHGGKAYQWKPEPEGFVQPGAENDYYRSYEAINTISGIPTNAPGTAIKGFLVQDNMANETQGPIEDRTQEHLGAHDKVLAALRTMLLVAMENVRKGKDPKHILRNPAENETVYVRRNDDAEIV